MLLPLDTLRQDACQQCVSAQVEKEIVKAVQHMEEVEVEVKKKKEISSRVKHLRKQVWLPVCLTCFFVSIPSTERRKHDKFTTRDRVGQRRPLSSI